MGAGNEVTRSFTPGKALAKAALGELSGVKAYLAENGAVNVQLSLEEMQVLNREVGGDSFHGNPSLKGQSGCVEVGDTMLHIAIRQRNKPLARYLLEHGAAVDIKNAAPLEDTALSLGQYYLIDVRSNFRIEERLIELFDMIDENKDGRVNEPEAIKFALVTTGNDEANAFVFWQSLPKEKDDPEHVNKQGWIDFFLVQFGDQQVAMVLAQLSEILDEVSRTRGQAIGQSVIAARTTPLRTLHHQSWVQPIRQSFSPVDRRTLMTSFRPRSRGHPHVPLYF